MKTEKSRSRSRSLPMLVLNQVSFPGKKFCQYCADSFFFWALVAILAIVEPILCTQHTKVGSPNHRLQVIVLAASSTLYFIQLIGVATREWEKIVMIEALTSIATLSVPKKGDFSFLKLFIFFTAEGEYILEFICLAGGWSVIFIWPGIAALRCFRVFRLLWFYEVEVFKSSVEHVLGPIIGRSFVSRGFKVLKFAIKSLTALGNELFRLTTETRGALLLIMMLVYSAFVIGLALWIETDSAAEFCGNIGECTYTLMRLTFFDGNGFDFAFFLTKEHQIMFMVVMVYMCLTSFGILNGLVGIFGTAIATASELAFNGDDQTQDASDEYSLSESDDEDDEDDDNVESYSESNGGIIYLKENSELTSPGENGKAKSRRKPSGTGEMNVSKTGTEKGSSSNTKPAGVSTQRNSTSSGGNGERLAITGDGSGASAGGNLGPSTADSEHSDHQEQKQAATGKKYPPRLEALNGDNAHSSSESQAEATMSVEEQEMVRMKLAVAFGSKTAFAQSQFKGNTGVSVKAKPKMSFKDLVRHSLDNKERVMTKGKSMKLTKLSPNASPRTGMPSATVERRRVHPTSAADYAPVDGNGAKRAAPVGLFAAKGALGKSIKNIVAQARENQAAGSAAGNGSVATQKDINVLLTNIHSLNRRIETQNDMIVALYTNIQFLNHQLQQVHPDLTKTSSDFQASYPTMKPTKNFAKNANALLPVNEATESNNPIRPMLTKQKTASHNVGTVSPTQRSPRRGSGMQLFPSVKRTSYAAPSPTVKSSPQVPHVSAVDSVTHALETMEETFAGALEAVDHGFDRALENASSAFKSISGSGAQRDAHDDKGSSPLTVTPPPDILPSIHENQSDIKSVGVNHNLESGSRSPSQLSEFTLPHDTTHTASSTYASGGQPSLSTTGNVDDSEKPLDAFSASVDGDGVSLVSKAIAPSTKSIGGEPHLLDDEDLPVTHI